MTSSPTLAFGHRLRGKEGDSYGASVCDLTHSRFGGFLGRAPNRATRISTGVTSRPSGGRSFDASSVQGQDTFGVHALDPALKGEVCRALIKQPQSSCPFRSIRQKVYGLGYSLLVFVYDKADDPEAETAVLKMVSTVFVDAQQTADFQMTAGLRRIMNDAARDGDSPDVTKQELMAFMESRSLTSEEHELRALADAVMVSRPNRAT